MPDVRFGSKSGHRSRSASCPLYPHKQTSVECSVMSALCQKRTLRSSFAHTDNRCSFSLDRPAECAEIPFVSRRGDAIG